MADGLPTVVVTCRVPAGSLAPLDGRAALVVNDRAEPWSRDELVARAAGAEALIVFMSDAVDAGLLAACPRLRIVAGALKGRDNIDVAACARAGVRVTVVPDLLTAPTADLTVGLLLALSRNLMAGDRLVRRGGFAGWRPVLYGSGLAGAEVGLIGMGAVGRAVARRLAAFGCRIANADERPLPDGEAQALGAVRRELHDLAAASDVLILALPLTGRTAGLVDARFLATVRPGCLLVNPARGSLVDEEAVADALADGRLGGYAADVFACEDLGRPGRPPGISARLLADDARTVLTPHLGSAVADVRHGIVREAALNVLDWLDGRSPRGAVEAPEDCP